jgi:hypothetical protein
MAKMPPMSKASARQLLRTAALGALAALPLLTALATSFGGCTTSSDSGSGATEISGSGSGGGGQGGGGGSGITGRDLFNALKPMLLEECGTCHKNGGISESPFLGIEGYEYESITSWPGIVVPTPSQSIILTHPADPSHGAGQAPDISTELRAKLVEWLKFEADDLPTPDSGTVFIQPFKPILKGALNTIYLDPFGTDFQYSSISFNAEELGDPPSMLLLTNVRMNPIAGVTLHVVHPLFTIYPPKGAPVPDPIDNFSSVDQTFSLKSPLEVGTGAAVLSSWEKDARLGIAFEAIEAQVEMGSVTTCKNVSSFKINVVPAMKYCADTCHGGANPDANATMDLSKLSDAVPDAACAQVRARIVPGDPASSQILIVTDPTQQAVHMYKFKGNVSNYNAFKMAVTPWILDEQ